MIVNVIIVFITKLDVICFSFFFCMMTMTIIQMKKMKQITSSITHTMQLDSSELLLLLAARVIMTTAP